MSGDQLYRVPKRCRHFSAERAMLPGGDAKSLQGRGAVHALGVGAYDGSLLDPFGHLRSSHRRRSGRVDVVKVTLAELLSGNDVDLQW